MNTYKEIYDLLAKKIIEQKEILESLELILKEKKEESIEISKKQNYYNQELSKLKREREIIINRHSNLIGISSMILCGIILVLTIYLGANIISGISTVTAKLLVELGLIFGLGNAYSLVTIGITIMSRWLIKKSKNKNKKKIEYINLTKEINKQNEELFEIEKEKIEIINEISKIASDILYHQKLIEESIREMKAIKEKIVRLVNNNSAEIVKKSFKNKTYIRTKQK